LVKKENLAKNDQKFLFLVKIFDFTQFFWVKLNIFIENQNFLSTINSFCQIWFLCRIPLNNFNFFLLQKFKSDVHRRLNLNNFFGVKTFFVSFVAKK